MKKILFLLCLSAFTLSVITAQTEEKIRELTVEEAVELAVQNNVSIKQSKMQLDLLKKQNAYSWNGVSPSFNLSGGVNDSLPDPLKDSSKNSLSYSVTAGVSIRFTPSLFTTMKAAKLAYENGEISYNTAKRTVEMNVRQTFYSLLNMKESIETSLKTLEAAKRTYESNLAKYNRGQLDQLTLLSSQYNYERQLPGIESSKNSYQSTMDNLKQVLGMQLTEPVILKGSLDDIINVQLDEAILFSDLESIPSVKNVYQNIKSVKNSLDATRLSAYGPSLSTQYSYSGGGGIDPSSDFGTRAHSLSINVSIPLDGYMPWSSGALSIESQKTNLAKTELQLEDAKTTAAISIRNSYNTILNAQAQLKILESNVQLMQRTYDMTLVAYNNGSKDLNSLQNAEDNLSSARYNLQAQKYTIINAVLRLEDTLGLPFGSLSQQNEKSE